MENVDVFKTEDRIKIKCNMFENSCIILPIEPVWKGECGTVVVGEHDDTIDGVIIIYCDVQFDGHVQTVPVPIENMEKVK